MENDNIENKITPLIGSAYSQHVINLLDKAKDKIDVLMFDWRWYPSGLGSPLQLFNQSFVRASRRGVKIRCLVNSDEIVKTLASVGISAKKIRSKYLLHSKLILLDGSFVVIGSHNISSHAFELNFETSVAFDDKDVNALFSNYFDSLWHL